LLAYKERYKTEPREAEGGNRDYLREGTKIEIRIIQSQPCLLDRSSFLGRFLLKHISNKKQKTKNPLNNLSNNLKLYTTTTSKTVKHNRQTLAAQTLKL
jgi:hypothetical protein